MRDRIETDRLLLRPLEPRDAIDIHRHCQDGEIARNTARIPMRYGLYDAEMFVLVCRAARGKRAGHIYAIADRGLDRLVGTCGVFKRQPDSADWEIGYWIGADSRRRGYATEAVGALCRDVRETLAPPRITAGHFADNPLSGRVLERLGFAYTGGETPLFCMGRMTYVTSLDMALEG
ncbi:GNAT family N-acetyltransferase [Hyphobacterium sp.]|jgi:RimJ/RimL family protein N-acetyltransferase|uniref:GNAT family N-acetyltransferase n=1 Tax=Hyphobacterium sp. TaxID=2004662 RepID=UPI003BAA5E7D